MVLLGKIEVLDSLRGHLACRSMLGITLRRLGWLVAVIIADDNKSLRVDNTPLCNIVGPLLLFQPKGERFKEPPFVVDSGLYPCRIPLYAIKELGIPAPRLLCPRQLGGDGLVVSMPCFGVRENLVGLLQLSNS